MRVRKKILITIMIIITLIFSLLTIQNEAVNETSNSTATKKSSNANLSDLGITPHDFKGFKYGTTFYEVVVPESTESIEVYAKTQDEKATLTGTGKKTLEKGENKAEVVVTAEDGTKKTYTINMIRGIQQDDYKSSEKEPEEDATEIGDGLAELKINNLALSPEFKTNVYEYTAQYIGEDTKLNIETKPTDNMYEIEVTGNDDLQEGENFITILVSEKNGDNVATYQIKVTKSLIDEEAIAKEEAKKKEKQQKIIIGAIVVGIAIIAGIIITIMIRKRNIQLEEEYSGRLSLDKEEDDYDEGEEEEVPKALKGKRYQEEALEEEIEEEDFENMPKQELKEKFLNGYTTEIDFDFQEEEDNDKKKRKHKGKRFK